jgi:hypothetical protein
MLFAQVLIKYSMLIFFIFLHSQTMGLGSCPMTHEIVIFVLWFLREKRWAVNPLSEGLRLALKFLGAAYTLLRPESASFVNRLVFASFCCFPLPSHSPLALLSSPYSPLPPTWHPSRSPLVRSSQKVCTAHRFSILNGGDSGWGNLGEHVPGDSCTELGIIKVSMREIWGGEREQRA